MKRKDVFISYSHKDRKWLDDLRVHLSYLEREYKFNIWEDSKINVGSDWRQEIYKALESTKVAVLLISANFISSNFINNEELPVLLQAAKEEGAYIFPIIVSYCMFSDIETLSKFQSVNSSSEPLSILSEAKRDELYVKVTKEIKRVLSSDTKTKSRSNNLSALYDLHLSFVKVRVMKVFYVNSDTTKGLSIKEIYEKSKVKKRKEVVAVIQDLETLDFLVKTKINAVQHYTLSEGGYSFVNQHSMYFDD